MNRFWTLGLAGITALGLNLSCIKPAAAGEPGQQGLTDVFSNIYRGNHWENSESRSGPGSTLRYTQTIRGDIERLIAELDITSVLDAACGDFGWMSLVDMQGASYIGMDVVPELIEELQANYGTEDGSRSFRWGDMTQDPLPQVDLIIARDVLGHLSLANAQKALRNFRASGARWLLTTTFSERRVNVDIADGGWRPINLVGAPFWLGRPVARFHEHGQRRGSVHGDKALGLWDLWAIDP